VIHSDFIVKSPLQYFPIAKGDYKIKFFEEFNEFHLIEKNHGWMGYNQNSFWQSSEFFIELEKAHGVCIVTGLGLGILQAHLCLKDSVSKIIVYEKSKDVVEMFYEITKYNNFDTSKLEIRIDDADLIKNQTCDCLFPDHFDSESEEHVINVVRNLSLNNNAQIVWYWPGVNHFVKYANFQNQPINADTYSQWKKYTGIKNLPTTLSDRIFSYCIELEKVYLQDVNGPLRKRIELSKLRKNLLNNSKKLR